MTVLEQVYATDQARSLINELKEEHGNLIFHQSGGCCDGSSPMCLKEGMMIIGDVDVQLGEIEGVPFYMNHKQYEYWKHTQITLDVVEGIGGMFSVEGPRGVRFHIRSEPIE
ncbi:hypothetical protein SAMN05216187_103202 [Jeotgalicoccus aerolatus]|uniref:UDP-glucose 4-epimerase n=1 Tax=Jeotgalicoccus aerolatus TaxID=709510 RepID=A0A1G8XNE0_9STAP|nr:DUF779 domain-containing protein [Jeotgalicoccus aerolatus]NMA81317.1 DUF779 domain-containing protein [Jeotgalicoccus aerolatus]SDJ91290.1 hypothetical protein SAMN05216187_103202 [Jeotgalicoccus aerolatus]HJG33570.1 DUF779 domain-containing protein [Jeotgalicoccus aerolatus]